MQYLRTQSTYDVLVFSGLIQIHIFMSVADKTGAFEVLLVPRYCLFAPKHPKWPTYRRPSPNGRNTRYSPGPNRVWYHSVHPLGGLLPPLPGPEAELTTHGWPKPVFQAQTHQEATGAVCRQVPGPASGVPGRNTVEGHPHGSCVTRQPRGGPASYPFPARRVHMHPYSQKRPLPGALRVPNFTRSRCGPDPPLPQSLMDPSAYKWAKGRA